MDVENKCDGIYGWFNPFADFIQSGGDVLKNELCTLAAAQAKCVAEPSCSGITLIKTLLQHPWDH